mgnify:CR=1 FL=1
MAKDYSNDELAAWFKSKASDTSGQAARNRIFAANDRSWDSAFVGKLYVFKYDAKTKDKLDMWDKYPLCLVLQRSKNGFLGLNLHYLPRSSRSTLLRSYDKYVDKDELDKGVTTGKGYSNWEILADAFDDNGLGSLPRKSLKRYLNPYVRSKFVEIYPEEFDRAIQLPIDLWVYKR